MMQQNYVEFEKATKSTLDRWKNTPSQKSNAEKNVAWATALAISQGNYNGFTSQNNARNLAMNLGKDGIVQSLLYNMIQLSDYRHQRRNESLGNIDAYIMMTVDACKQDQVGQL